MTQKQYNLAIFASGAGSNADKIIEYFQTSPTVRVRLVVTNKPGAGVVNVAARNNIPLLVIEKEKFFRGDHYIPELDNYKIDYIILAGFLWKVPSQLIKRFERKIINIHPALLPAYGGKGMYGNFVHDAVIKAGETKSGITIHFVDELYDNGEHIFQAECPVLPGDTSDSLAQKIHVLEHTHFGPVIEKLLTHK